MRSPTRDPDATAVAATARQEDLELLERMVPLEWTSDVVGQTSMSRPLASERLIGSHHRRGVVAAGAKVKSP